ncbi:hypothetical protein [Methylobacter sp. YRD-M1]|nr:hypothetical protein [Methylobacter sp. YRD-M1]
MDTAVEFLVVGIDGMVRIPYRQMHIMLAYFAVLRRQFMAG